MRINTRVGMLPVGHVFVTPLTRRLGSVTPPPPGLMVVVGEERAVQELDGVGVDLRPIPSGIRGMWADYLPERKALHPDVVVEIADENQE